MALGIAGLFNPVPRCEGATRFIGNVKGKGLLTIPDANSVMIRMLALLLPILGACNAPSQPFRGILATQVTVDGSTFDVRVSGNRAEAIRTNAQYAPRFGPIRERAGKAMAMVSGCKVVRVDGDQAMATGALDCGKGAPSARKRGVKLECIPVRGTAMRGIGAVIVDADCYPI